MAVRKSYDCDFCESGIVIEPGAGMTFDFGNDISGHRSARFSLSKVLKGTHDLKDSVKVMHMCDYCSTVTTNSIANFKVEVGVKQE